VRERVARAICAVLCLWSARAGGQSVERLTLDQALKRALARNPDVLVAASEVRRAEALIIQARSSAFPTLLPAGTYTRIDHARRFMGNTALAANQWGATAPLTLPLIAPRAWADWAHARDDHRVAQLDAAQVRRQIAIAVANAYLAVIAQQRTLALAKVSRDNAAAHADYTRQRATAGAVSELDDVRAQEQLHTTQAQLETVSSALAQAREALGLLVAGDRPVDAAEEPRFALPGPSDQPDQREDILWLRMRQTAARNQVRDSYVDYLPRLIGEFTPIFTEPPTFIQPRWGWQLQLTLVLPLYDGGLRRGQRLARGALLDEATDTLIGQLRAASSEVRLARLTIAMADTRVREAKQAALLARRALEISVLRYRQGATTNIEVIDAERQARQADFAAALADDNAQQTRLDLLAASGGFP
jgi:outer membrane protein TolC